jgi:DNA-binding SARP family transcriptional activator
VSRFEFGLLGPLEVRGCGTVLPIPRGKQRVLLAALLLSANRVVSADALIEILWPQAPPPSARPSLQNYVKRLRQALGDAGRARVITSEPGYLIQADRDELDVTRFEYLIAAARASARGQSWRSAVEQLRTALDLWRGEPLMDVRSEPLVMHGIRLRELRLQAVAECIEAELHLGYYAEVLAELRELVDAHPLREKFHALLVIALDRCGRRDDALTAYRRAHRQLRQELGIDPGEELRELQRRVLNGEPTLNDGSTLTRDRHEAPATGASARFMVPRQLPAAPRYFVGREPEQQALDRLRQLPGAVPIATICGAAGVGKTALAVHWAHRAAEFFPDGQLYVDLRGFSPSLTSVTPAEALQWLLLALQIPRTQIPGELDVRTALYRSALFGRKVLLVVDNAACEQDVRPLLPGAPGCMVVVTSRSQLIGLVSAEGAQAISLDPLDRAMARQLVAARLGTQRLERETQACDDLIALCARLPLALSIATARCATEPVWSVAAEMRDARKRIAALETGDPATSARVVFSWSYGRLSVPAARLFRLLGVHCGLDITTAAAASLTGIPEPEARELIIELVNAHLATEHNHGRFVLHELLRAYAAELAETEDSQSDRREALTRVLDHYMYVAAAAMDILYPAESDRRPRIAPSQASTIPRMADPAAAHVWLESELANLVAAVAHAADHSWPSHATRLAATLLRHLQVTGHYPEIITVYTHVLRVARCTGDRLAEADALQGLTFVALRHSRYGEAASHLRQALVLYRDLCHHTGEVRVLGNLGITSFQLGRYREAASYHRRALARYRQLGDHAGEVRTLNNLSLVDIRQGNWHRAADQLRRALDMTRPPHLGVRDMEFYCLANLGIAEMRLGQLEIATARLRNAVALSRDIGDPAGESYSLVNLAAACLRQGRHRQASDHLRRALALSQQLCDESGMAEALNGLGELLLATDRPAPARDKYEAALALAKKVGDRYEQARAHDGLACAYDAVGEAAESARHCQAAMTLFARLGTPDADQSVARAGPVDRRSLPPCVRADQLSPA